MGWSNTRLVCEVIAEIAAPFEQIRWEPFRPKLKRTLLHALCGCLPSLFLTKLPREEFRHQASYVEKLRVKRIFPTEVREDVVPKLHRAGVFRHPSHGGWVRPMHPPKEEQVQGRLSIPVSRLPTVTKLHFHPLRTRRDGLEQHALGARRNRQSRRALRINQRAQKSLSYTPPFMIHPGGWNRTGTQPPLAPLAPRSRPRIPRLPRPSPFRNTMASANIGTFRGLPLLRPALPSPHSPVAAPPRRSGTPWRVRTFGPFAPFPSSRALLAPAGPRAGR